MKDSDISEFNIFYIGGIGCSGSGEGSAYAWIEARTKRTHTLEAYGMSTNEAKFQALLSIIFDLPPETEALIRTDSRVVARHFNGDRWPADPVLLDVCRVACQMIYEKHLTIHVEMIKRNRNPAWKLLAASRQRAL
jgi:hypothetical protein